MKGLVRYERAQKSYWKLFDATDRTHGDISTVVYIDTEGGVHTRARADFERKYRCTTAPDPLKGVFHKLDRKDVRYTGTEPAIYDTVSVRPGDIGKVNGVHVLGGTAFVVFGPNSKAHIPLQLLEVVL